MNNKGITLVEIIISIVLISIVLIFLFSLLISVNDMNYESEVNSTYLINKSLILKNIEEDFDKASNISVSTCGINEFYTNYGIGDYFPKIEGVDDPNFTKKKCLKITYEWPDPTKIPDSGEPGYLGIYYYKTHSTGSYVITYKRGSKKITKELPGFENIPNNLLMYWEYPNGILNDGFYNIYIPITGSDGKDYSLNISYYKNT